MYTVTTTWPAFILSAGCPVRRDWLNLQYRFLEDTMDAHLTALSQLVQVMVHSPLDGASLAWWYGQALFTLPYVRKALLMRPPIERDLRNVRMPVLLTHGLADRITFPRVWNGGVICFRMLPYPFIRRRVMPLFGRSRNGSTASWCNSLVPFSVNRRNKPISHEIGLSLMTNLWLFS
jgi:pimeloyl-ACP methyl ester carboxylesterase